MPKKKSTTNKNTTQDKKNLTLMIGITCVLLGVCGILFLTNDTVMNRFSTIFNLGKNIMSASQNNDSTIENSQNSGNKQIEKQMTQKEEQNKDKTPSSTGSEEKNQPVAKKGDKVTVDYVGKLKNGKVFDTSYEKIARNNNVYQSGRNYDDGLTFVIGGNNLLPKFEQTVVGMQPGETVSVSIPAEEGYGKRPQTLPKTQLPPKPDNAVYQTSDVLQTNMGDMKIVGIEETTVDIQPMQMHPLANQDLIFDITLREIK